MTLLNSIFLVQYLFLNGFLVHRFFLKEKNSTALEAFLASLCFSICLNSLALYILARAFHMPITTLSVIIMSIAVSLAIVALAKHTKKLA